MRYASRKLTGGLWGCKLGAARALSKRQSHREGRPDAESTGGGNITAHGARKVAADGESKSGSPGWNRSGRAELDERLKDLVDFVGRYARSSVPHPNQQRFVLNPPVQLRGTALGRELHGVGQQVHDDLLDLLTIAENRKDRIAGAMGVDDAFLRELREDKGLGSDQGFFDRYFRH